MTALGGLRARAHGQLHLRGELQSLDRLEGEVRAAAAKTARFHHVPNLR